ncbi:MAG: YiiX family permuted papain-like enzyme [Zoogloeaceae bacterium]|nr:YiiX family permuted papain-like enzyme [Zoogloeaceae bacterium]
MGFLAFFDAFLLCLVLSGALHAEAPPPAVLEGDLIFQTSGSRQSLAIQRATKSRYSHMGIIFREQDEYFVYEAVQPVKKTPLAEWIKRGKEGKFALRRLKARAQILTPQTLAKMKEIATGYLGNEYDAHFAWDDERLYCSELVWKIYQRGAGQEIGKLQKLGDFDLNDKLVQAQLRERFGSQVPLDETVISPAAMLSSERLFAPAF